MQTILSSCRRAGGTLLVATLFLVSGATAEAADPPEPLVYDAATQQLSASIEALSAADLLHAVAAAADIRVRVRGELGTVQAQSFADLPLDEAIQRLFRSPDRSLVMLYEATPHGGQRLAEVRLSAVSSGQTERAARPRAGPPPAPVAAARVALPPPPPTHLRLPPPPPPPRQRLLRSSHSRPRVRFAAPTRKYR